MSMSVPGSGGEDEVMSTINTTPLVDVMREFTGDLEANLIGGVKPDLPAAHRPAAAPAAKK